MNRWLVALVLCCGGAGWTVRVEGQVERYELGKRLQRFERAWQGADAEARAKSMDPMQAAVRRFFSLQMRSAASKLDEAWFAVRGAPPSEFERTGAAYQVRATPVVMDSKARAVSVQVPSFYDARPTMPLPTQARIRLWNSKGETVVQTETAFTAKAEPVELVVDALGAGAYELAVELGDGKQWVELPRVTITKVERWNERIAELDQRLERLPEAATDTARATFKSTVELLKSIAQGRVQEIDYPIDRLLELLDALEAAQGDSTKTLGKFSAAGDAWLTAARGANQLPIRLRAPAKANGKLPVLVLFHGAGGSENMFFETYGAGRAVSLALERGWLVVAPRQGFLGMGLDCEGLLQVLEEHFPIDRERVFYVGHSMGAAQALRQFGRAPELPSAVAAIGGGGAVASGEAAKQVAWFVAAGEFDFGKSGGVALQRSLEKAGVTTAEFREYANVEHMVVVQAALDDLFAFLDKAAKK